jgi:hypothetical protein
LSVPGDPEAAYYQAVEEPLFLSNTDWLLVRRWRQDEVPLRVVLRGIADALDGHAHSWGRHRKVGSLAYCAAEVDAARDRWRRALDLGQAPGVETKAALDGLRDALRGAKGLGLRAAGLAARTVGEIGALGGARLSEVEPRLAAAEAALVAAIAEDDGPGVVAEVEAEVDGLLRAYRGRMPERVLAEIRDDSRKRRLLERHGLPRLSLFHACGLAG